MWKTLNNSIKKVDNTNIWYLGIPFIVLLFLPIFILQKGAVFSIHDQLDETLFTYVLNARHLFDGAKVFPEMLGGIAKSGMQPAAVLFIPLYRFLPVFTAFVVQYMVVSASAFYGMYLLVRRVTGSSGIAFVTGALFTMLPYQPVYGLSIVGVPLLCFCFIQLCNREHIGWSIVGIVYFGLTTHLVLIGYVALIYLAMGGVFIGVQLAEIAIDEWRGTKERRIYPKQVRNLPMVCNPGYVYSKEEAKEHVKESIRIYLMDKLWYFIGALVLFITYCIVNLDMFLQLIVGTEISSAIGKN